GAASDRYSFPTRRSSDLSDNVVRMIERFTMRHYLKSHRKLALFGASVAIGALALSGCGNQKGQGNAEADSGSSGDGDESADGDRSEEHTSELQSRFDIVC